MFIYPKLFYLCLLLLCVSGCWYQPVQKRIAAGKDMITIDGSSGTVVVLHINSLGNGTKLLDTKASQEDGWSLEKISETHLRLTTNDLGDFDITFDGEKWQVAPPGTFFSPGKFRAVRFVPIDASHVEARLGETEPPYTDMFIYDQETIAVVSIADLNVRWINSKHAQVTNSRGQILADLHGTSDPAAINFIFNDSRSRLSNPP